MVCPQNGTAVLKGLRCRLSLGGEPTFGRRAPTTTAVETQIQPITETFFFRSADRTAGITRTVLMSHASAPHPRGKQCEDCLFYCEDCLFYFVSKPRFFLARASGRARRSRARPFVAPCKFVLRTVQGMLAAGWTTDSNSCRAPGAQRRSRSHRASLTSPFSCC